MSEKKSIEEIERDIAKSLVTWLLHDNKDLIKEAHANVVAYGFSIDRALDELSKKLHERIDKEEL